MSTCEISRVFRFSKRNLRHSFLHTYFFANGPNSWGNKGGDFWDSSRICACLDDFLGAAECCEMILAIFFLRKYVVLNSFQNWLFMRENAWDLQWKKLSCFAFVECTHLRMTDWKKGRNDCKRSSLKNLFSTWEMTLQKRYLLWRSKQQSRSTSGAPENGIFSSQKWREEKSEKCRGVVAKLGKKTWQGRNSAACVRIRLGWGWA